MQCGLGGGDRGPWLRFKAVRLPEPVRDVSLAQHHAVALTDTGKLLQLGGGDSGQPQQVSAETFTVSRLRNTLVTSLSRP